MSKEVKQNLIAIRVKTAIAVGKNESTIYATINHKHFDNELCKQVDELEMWSDCVVVTMGDLQSRVPHENIVESFYN